MSASLKERFKENEIKIIEKKGRNKIDYKWKESGHEWKIANKSEKKAKGTTERIRELLLTS